MTDVRLSISVDASQGRNTLQQFQAGYKALINQLRQPLGRIASLRELETSLVDNERQLNATRRHLSDLASEMLAAERPTRAQIQAYRAASQQADALQRSIAGQRLELAELSQALRSAGVDTTRLAAEQKRLAAELDATQGRASAQAERIAGARAALNVRPHADIRQEINGLTQQYQLLRNSGTLTTGELLQAKVRLRERVAELKTGTNGWAKSLGEVRMQAGVAAASMGALAYGGSNVLGFYAKFGQQMAAVDSITDLSRERFAQLSQEVRQLSVNMGKDAAESAAALNDILSSGVDEKDGISTLALSTKAAVAGVTDTATAARGGLAVVNAYGEGIENLGLRYDQMFLAVRDGVTTFPELANFIGDVLPTAKAAGVGFDEVSAAIARMTIAGIRTPQATTALKGAINALAAPTPEAQKKLDELGIKWRGLSGTLQDIAARKLGLEAMREIIPDVEARTAVLSLTQDIGALNSEVAAMRGASGAMDAAYAKMSNTPQADLDRFNSAVGELKLSLGETATAFLPVVNGLTGVLQSFNALPQPVKSGIAMFVAFSAGLVALRTTLVSLANPLMLLRGHLSQAPGAAGAASAGLESFAGTARNLLPQVNNLADAFRLLKGTLALGVVTWSAGNVAELWELHNRAMQLRQDQIDYRNSLNETITTTAKYADAVILPANAVAKLNEKEKKAYIERLRLAENHYRKVAELQSRDDMEKNGPAAAVSQEALAAQRRASEFRKAQTDIEDAQRAREGAETRHREALAKIKNDQRAQIQKSLAAELLLYEEANKKLEAANKAAAEAIKKRVEVNKEFAQLAQDLAAPEKKGPATLADVTKLKADARRDVQEGNSADALRKTRQAAAVLRELKEAGANTYGYSGIAKELGQIADQAARLDEVKADAERANAQASVDSIKATMDDLLAKAEAFKRIDIQFNGFEQSAAALEAQAVALAERMKKYMTIPVNYVGADGKAQEAANKSAGEIMAPAPVKRAAGGWIDGPGSPTSDSISMLGSRNEFVLQARAALRLGASNLEYMNRTGELPASRAALVPMIPQLPESFGRMGERQPLNLAMPWGGSYALEGPPSEVARFQEDLERVRTKYLGSKR
ncbi:phage tail tape measure protein [Pseudomonas sp. ENNP23]|uniref:phage tail tape measure protein n=1 Tax=Pseudomonas sp. ENNP23 TaxID=1535636 RepID=UPI00084ACE3D|nr:phage tail tape measure protein [Pseudomonas sp. ENNP23]OEC61293.1 phage tail tape measure protein [Pseudomonas sp. ENNP23]